MPYDIDQTTKALITGRQALMVVDGDCLLCNHLVHWLSQRDRRGCFLFTTLTDYQSVGAVRTTTPNNSVILLTKGKTYTHSTALLEALQLLGGPWKVARFFLYLVPKIIRDSLYNFISARRHLISRRLPIRKIDNRAISTLKILQKNDLMSLLLNMTSCG